MDKYKKIHLLRMLQARKLSLKDFQKMIVDTDAYENHSLKMFSFESGKPDEIRCGKEVYTRQEFSEKYPVATGAFDPMRKTGFLLFGVAKPPDPP